MTKVAIFSLETDYEGYSKLENTLIKLNVPKLSLAFENEVKLSVAVNLEEIDEDEFVSKIRDLFKGKEVIKAKDYGYYAFKV